MPNDRVFQEPSALPSPSASDHTSDPSSSHAAGEPKSQETAASDKISVWTYKPWWCQPWSILSTGFGAIALSWLVLHRYWVTGLVAVPMLTWMGFFLLAFPKLAAESGMLEEMKRAHQEQD